MILKDLLDYFNIEDNLPDYLLNYSIEVTTRQKVTHQMHIRPNDEFPVIIISRLPNGNLNGMKFGQNDGDEKFIDDL